MEKVYAKNPGELVVFANPANPQGKKTRKKNMAHRQPSEYNEFVGKKLHDGYSMKEAIKMWDAKKGKRRKNAWDGDPAGHRRAAELGWEHRREKKHRHNSESRAKRSAAAKRGWKEHRSDYMGDESFSERSRAAKRGWAKRRRHNPDASDVLETSKSMLVKYSLVGVAAVITIRGLQYVVGKFGSKLPAAVQDSISIGVPLVGGIWLGMKSDSVIGQGAAGGMVLASVTSAIDKFVPIPGGSGISDAMKMYLGDGNIAVSANGVVTSNGQPVAQLQPITAPVSQNKAYLGDGSDNESGEGSSWEQTGEVFAA